MKMKEYFDSLPVGEVVNRRGLAYLKRIGMIEDYSEWGYLEESSWDLEDNHPDGVRAFGNEFEARYFSGCFRPYLVKVGPDNGKNVNRRICLWGAIL